MRIDGGNSSLGNFGNSGVGQHPGDSNNLKQQIEELKNKIQQQSSQGGGGSQGAGGAGGESLEELLKKLLQQLSEQNPQGNQSAGGMDQQAGSGSGGGQIQFPPSQ